MHGELGWVHTQPISMGGVVLWCTCVEVVSWLLDTGLGPKASLQCRTSGNVFQALRVWKRGSEMGQLNFDNMVPVVRNFMSCGCGTNRDPPSVHWLHYFLYAYVFLCTCKCTQKICLQAAYKQKQKPDLWPHSFLCSFASPKRPRNLYLMELPQDAGTEDWLEITLALVNTSLFLGRFWHILLHTSDFSKLSVGICYWSYGTFYSVHNHSPSVWWLLIRTKVLGNADVATGELTSDVSVFVPEGMRNTDNLFLTQI